MFEVQLKTGAFLLSQAILGPNTWHEQKKQILNEELLIALKSEIVTVYSLQRMSTAGSGRGNAFS